MTAEEIVMSGYAAFGSGDMDALGKLYHPLSDVSVCETNRGT